MNLLSNACKFTQDGTIEVTAWIINSEKDSVTEELIDNLEKGVLYVSVKDTGTGIPEKEMGNIFTEFFTLKSNANLNPNGVGLGLSICKKICKQLDGDIVFESKVGFGSTFTFNVAADLLHSKPKTPVIDVESETISDFSLVANQMDLVFQQFKPREEKKNQSLELAMI